MAGFISSTRSSSCGPILKRSLANLAKLNLAQLTALVKARLKRGCSTGPACATASSPAPGPASHPSVTRH